MTIQENEIKAVNPSMWARGEFHREVANEADAIQWAKKLGIRSFEVNGLFYGWSESLKRFVSVPE